MTTIDTGDKEFLQWIHDRLVNVHGEKPGYDYMLKLKSLAAPDKGEVLKPTIQLPNGEIRVGACPCGAATDAVVSESRGRCAQGHYFELGPK